MVSKQRSLNSTIVLRLAIPLIFFITIESVLSYFVTLHHVDVAYDGWLLDSARSLTPEIKAQDGGVFVELPPAALEIFKWDESDKTYFKIISAQNVLIAGDKSVPEPHDLDVDWANPVYFDDKMHGEPVRVVSMMIAPEFSDTKVFVHVAETLNKRRSMMIDILLADLLPQLALVLLVGFYLVLGVKRGLQPLHILADEIAKRSSRDLRPIPEQHVFLEVRALTDTINDLLARLGLSISTQQRFIANAAHQLRTPLAGLKLQVERAQREQNLAEMKPALMHIQSSADRMSHLTTQLLLLARSEPIDGNYELRPVDLNELVKQTCIDWVPKALQRQIELSFYGLNESLMVNGDEVLLRELLANLLDNAICYGHDKGHILVKITPTPFSCLSVEDDGCGIPESEVEKVFERFYRMPGSQGDGCGLGLAIVKEIADLHGASLELNRLSAVGGTQIKLVFKD